MLKKILYGILVIAMIIILVIIWKKPKTEAPSIVDDGTSTQVEGTTAGVDTSANINADLDKINIDSGIDTDLKVVDTSIKIL